MDTTNEGPIIAEWIEGGESNGPTGLFELPAGLYLLASGVDPIIIGPFEDEDAFDEYMAESYPLEPSEVTFEITDSCSSTDVGFRNVKTYSDYVNEDFAPDFGQPDPNYQVELHGDIEGSPTELADALRHIARMIDDGYTSGYGPGWKLVEA